MITFGSDIELFLMDKEGNYISSQFLFPTNESIKSKWGIIERDGYAIEIQPKYGKSVLEFIYHTQQLILLLKKYLDQKELSISLEHCINIDIQQLIDNEDYDSLIFGCKKDSSIYTGKFNIKKDATQVSLRACGGHIHISIPNFKSKRAGIYYFPANKDSQKLAENVIYWMDLTLGLSSVVLDKPSERRKIYGKTGDFRYTKYGIEYRTLSNFFLFNPILFHQYFQTAKKCIKFAEKNPYIEYNISSEEVIEAINNYNKSLSIELMDYSFKHNHFEIYSFDEPSDFEMNIENWF